MNFLSLGGIKVSASTFYITFIESTSFVFSVSLLYSR